MASAGSLGYLQRHATSRKETVEISVPGTCEPTMDSSRELCSWPKGSAISLVRMLLTLSPFLVAPYEPGVAAGLALLLLIAHRSSNAPGCFNVCAVAVYSGANFMLLEQLMDDSVVYTVFAIIMGVHLLPLIILGWPRFCSLVTAVGVIVNISAWYALGMDTVAIAYPLLSAVAGLFLLTTLYLCSYLDLYMCSPVGHLMMVCKGDFFTWKKYRL